MNTLVEIESLTKTFKKSAALQNVSLRCEPGRIIGLLGPNGSGKTTLLNAIAGLVLPTSGSVTTLGSDAGNLEATHLAHLGFVQQESDLLGWLTVRDHLDFTASFYPRWDRQRQSALLDRFDIDDEARVGTLSVGDRQKLAVVMGVCHHPRLILLDEPASALDPTARASLLKLLLEIIQEDDATIIISSHVLVDVEKVIDHVWFLRKGQLVADVDLDTLKEGFAEWTVTPLNGAALPRRFAESFVVDQRGDALQRLLRVRDPAAHRDAFAATHQLSLSERPLNLEAIYPLLLKSE